MIGCLALAQERGSITKYFLKDRAKQFGVGLAGGCELMSTAVASYLELHEDWVDISVDASSAFNSFDRGPAFAELRKSFPSFPAFGRLSYVKSERIVFHEDGIGLTEASSNVGTRQGFTWGSFVYCPAIHLLPVQLDKESGGGAKGSRVRRRCSLLGPSQTRSCSNGSLGVPLRGPSAGAGQPKEVPVLFATCG